MCNKIIRRKTEKTAWCRGCRKEMQKGTDIVNIPSYAILLCLDCARLVGNLSIDNEKDNE